MSIQRFLIPAILSVACGRSELQGLTEAAVAGMAEAGAAGTGRGGAAEAGASEAGRAMGGAAGTTAEGSGGSVGGAPQPCGNGQLDDGEECDDGDLASHDGCSSGCTLEGPTWIPIPTNAAPEGSPGTTMVYHAPRLPGVTPRLLLIIDDVTWALDASGWVRVASAPPVMFSAAAQGPYDITFLFGGETDGGELSGQTWTFGGSSWGVHQYTAGTWPGPRHAHALVSRGPDQSMLLFGGCVMVGCAQMWGDTWQNGYSTEGVSGWSQLSPLHAPSPRSGHAMAYHAPSGQTVLFGGWLGTGGESAYLGDTWIFEGDDWREVLPSPSPASRSAHEMVYDEASGRLVLFGGYCDVGAYRGDTWEWIDGGWVLVDTGNAPQPRGSFGMAYDRERRGTVLFGGCIQGSCLSDTWLYQHASSWPDEDCQISGDEDRDGVSDCADPDCTSRPCPGGWCDAGVCAP